MPKKTIRITLFHASWCGHCTNFIPTWEKMTGDKNAQKNIEFVDYEEAGLASLPDTVKTINGSQARQFGFPTLKISIDDAEYLYEGQRTPESIYTFVVSKIQKMTGTVNPHPQMAVTYNNTSDKYSDISVSTEIENVYSATKEYYNSPGLKGGKSRSKRR